ncbi:hypothetical protein ACIRYZ_40425 [Kitasatospora sp. NPDC101155]|uniref:hypothetical protein n=1 Tax=Kitasatospora sp. NPDC101155 TaxID=3364097 RepID=UPI00382587F0
MTATDHYELTAALSALADEPAPPAAFDITASIARGRARRHRRHRATAGAVAVVAAAALTATMLMKPGNTTPAVQTLPAVTATATPTPAPTSTATRAAADPLSTEVSYGWLPDWVDQPGRIDREIQAQGIYSANKDTGRNIPRLDLQLYPAGVEPPMENQLFPRGMHLVREDAPPIDGRTAYWATLSGGKQTWSLRWLTPSGRWAELIASNGTPEQTSRDVLLKVANGVKYGHRDVPLPVQFTGLPEEFGTPDLVQLSRPDPGGRGAWNLYLHFKVQGKIVTLELRPDTDEPGSMPTGHPTPAPTCESRNEVWICADAFGGTPPALEQIGGLSGLLSRAEPIGVNERDWTTDVFVR